MPKFRHKLRKMLVQLALKAHFSADSGNTKIRFRIIPDPSLNRVIFLYNISYAIKFFLFLNIIVEGLHREFLRAGSDVMQAFTYYASDDKLEHRGNTAGAKYTGRGINLAAAEIAKKVAAEGDALVLGGISQCPSYLDHLGKAKVQHEFRKQVRVFVEAGLDFLLCEVNCQIYF